MRVSSHRRRPPDERMEVAQAELAGVRVTRLHFVALTLAFVATVATAVLFEVSGVEAPTGEGPAGEDPPLPGTSQELGVPGLGVVQELSDRLAAAGGRRERRVSADSHLTERLAAPVQRFLGERTGGGNEQVYFGRGGWLFFVPDVDHVVGRPFLAPAHLRARLASGAALPDPALGVLLFAAELDRFGIQLVVVPVPSKATFHAGQLSNRAAGGRPRNPSYERFVAELQDPGLLLRRYDDWLPRTYGAAAWFAPLREAVADLSDRLAEEALPSIQVVDVAAAIDQLGEAAAFLRTDTHWTPAGADTVAAATAASVRKLLAQRGRNAALRRRDLPVSQLGDIAVMAQFQGERWREEVVTRQVIAGDRLAASALTGRVLLLGDSFSNVFSWNRMGWGEGAGFGELLAFHLAEDVSWLARNADGAHASRDALRQAVSRGEPVLERARVVVWQFAARELSVGDWRPSTLSPPEAETVMDAVGAPFVTVPDDEAREVTGIVVDISRPPLPDSVPYPDHVSYVHLSDLTSPADVGGGQMLVATLSMEAGRWTDAARLRLGDPASFLVRNYAVVDAEARVSRVSATDLESDVMFETPNWGELMVTGSDPDGAGPTALHWILAAAVLLGAVAGTLRISRALPGPPEKR